jgi:hypothetical protein
MASKNYDIQIQAVEQKIKKLQIHLDYLKNLKAINEEEK